MGSETGNAHWSDNAACIGYDPELFSQFQEKLLARKLKSKKQKMSAEVVTSGINAWNGH